MEEFEPSKNGIQHVIMFLAFKVNFFYFINVFNGIKMLELIFNIQFIGYNLFYVKIFIRLTLLRFGWICNVTPNCGLFLFVIYRWISAIVFLQIIIFDDTWLLKTRCLIISPG